MTATPELKAARAEMRGVREMRLMPTGLELREIPNGTGGVFLRCSGYASVTCPDDDDDSNAYEMEDAYGPWIESVMRGAFTKTLADGADVAFLANHTGVSMARTKPGTLILAEDSTGLHYEAQLNPQRPDVQILRAAIEEGAIDESSFAFRVLRQEWNKDYTRRWIREINLDKGDVSPVNYGANPHTSGLLAIRGRRGGRGTRANGTVAVLPDYTSDAKVKLARLRHAPASSGGKTSGYVSPAMRKVERMRQRVRLSERAARGGEAALARLKGGA